MGFAFEKLLSDLNISLPEVPVTTPTSSISGKGTTEEAGAGQAETKDDAMLPAVVSHKDVGGIDFNPDRLDIETRGAGIDFDFDAAIDPALLEQLESAPINGFTPFIFQITPIKNLPLLLGVGKSGLELDSDSNSEKESIDLSLHRDKFFDLYSHLWRRRIMDKLSIRLTICPVCVANQLYKKCVQLYTYGIQLKRNKRLIQKLKLL